MNPFGGVVQSLFDAFQESDLAEMDIVLDFEDNAIRMTIRREPFGTGVPLEPYEPEDPHEGPL